MICILLVSRCGLAPVRVKAAVVVIVVVVVVVVRN